MRKWGAWSRRRAGAGMELLRRRWAGLVRRPANQYIPFVTKPPPRAGAPNHPIRGGMRRRFSTGGGHGANFGPSPPAAEESIG